MTRMHGIAVLALAAAMRVTAAQEANPYNGTWIASWTGDMGDLFEPQAAAEVNITGNRGTWRMLRRPARASCAQLDWPVEVVRATNQGLGLRVHASEALQGCRDFGVRLKRASETRLEGTMGTTKPIVFERK